MSGRAGPVGGSAVPGATTWWDRRFPWLIAALVVLAAGVRLAAIYVAQRTSPIGLGGDGFHYVISAWLLAAGQGFSFQTAKGIFPDALHPPLWIAFLAGVHWLGAQTVEQTGLAASALGVGTTVLVALLGRYIASARTGAVAGALIAVSPAFWTYERNLNAEAITFPLIAAALLLTYRYHARPTLGRCLALASTLGLLALARSEQALLIPAVFVPLVLSTAAVPLRRRIWRLALSGAVILAIIAPWTIYNLHRFERPIILSAGAGNAMLAGACDTTFSGEHLGSYDSACVLHNPVFWKNTDRSVQDGALRAEAIRYTLNHLEMLPAVLAAREGRSWGFFRPAQQVLLQAESLAFAPRIIWLQMILYWTLVPLAVAGAALRRRHVILYPLLALPALSIISTAMTFGDIRYRAPAEIPLVLLAAAAIDGLLLPTPRLESLQDSTARAARQEA